MNVASRRRLSGYHDEVQRSRIWTQLTRWKSRHVRICQRHRRLLYWRHWLKSEIHTHIPKWHKRVSSRTMTSHKVMSTLWRQYETLQECDVSQWHWFIRYSFMSDIKGSLFRWRHEPILSWYPASGVEHCQKDDANRKETTTKAVYKFYQGADVRQ